MPKTDESTAQVVDDLLTERRKLEKWLARLDEATDASKAQVAHKVRSDYQRRLDEVTEELGKYGDGLQKQRDTHARELDKLQGQEAERAEELAEAELRHAVGEFDERAWESKKSSIEGKLKSIRDSIGEAEKAMAGLDEVLASIAGREEVEEEEEEEEEENEPEPEPEPEPPPPPKSSKKKRGQSDAFDELEFLKSVSDDDEEGPSPRRASGKVSAIPDEGPPPKRKTPASITKDSGEDVVGASRPSAVNQRTLKCRECGSFNLPTEWYCEKCGAELASL